MNSTDKLPKKRKSPSAHPTVRQTDQTLFGGDESLLVDGIVLSTDFAGHWFHRDMVDPLTRLCLAARTEGFDVRLASAYRSFERQRMIWDGKARGERALLDEQGRPLDARALDAASLVRAILRWSALPGSSRHHWGTDVDVYDARALNPGEQVRLTRAETEPGGPFAPFHLWLTDYLNSDQNPGFYRPYDRDRGGVAPEPWHLSYAPLANRFAEAMTLDALSAFLDTQSFAMKEIVMAQLPDVYQRFVCVPFGPEANR